MVGRACGLPEGQGVRPGTYCEPRMTTVGSQDTTGPMTRDELKDLACLGFSADLVMQSFCHTAAYPKPVDVKTHHELPGFITTRGGVALQPGDGVIHSWLNRLLLPDTVGTGGDSHTRFPIGISFPAGSGLVAFAAATGVMPLDMPESVLVRFKGEMQPGITLRDLVNAIPYAAIQQGLLTVEKKGKKNIFSGRILEIEGLPDLKVEQAFELSDASAERSAAGCTVRLNKEPVIEYLNSNIALMKWHDRQRLRRHRERSSAASRRWRRGSPSPKLLEPDADAEYAAVIEIDLADDQGADPGLPERPGRRQAAVDGGRSQDRRSVHRLVHDQHRPLPRRRPNCSKASATCRPAVGRAADQDGRGAADARKAITPCSAAPARAWRCPAARCAWATRRRSARARRPSPPRPATSPTAWASTPSVYLGSAELAAVCARPRPHPDHGRVHRAASAPVGKKAAEIYRYMNFDQIPAFSSAA